MTRFTIDQPVITPGGLGFYKGRLTLKGQPPQVVVSHTAPGANAPAPRRLFSYAAAQVLPVPTFQAMQTMAAPADQK